jgi:L-histidine N-alpha-methyltransferase
MASTYPPIAFQASFPESMLPSTEPSAESLSVAAVVETVREGLTANPKKLPPWLFYDEAGSLLFEEITSLPEYYPTRLERGLFRAHASEMIAAAADGQRLRLVELGAGSADKTRMLLAAAVELQGRVDYQPVDVSATALDSARARLAVELPAVHTVPMVADYTVDWVASPDERNQRQLLLWIGSSIGNFEPEQAIELLRRINDTMRPGDGLLLGVDLAPFPYAEQPEGCKCVCQLEAAYDDADGITADFNKNLLVRLNRELGADFEPERFIHRAVWNARDSRMEMHLESREAQAVWIDALGSAVRFNAGERLHTENSYKYSTEGIAGLMAQAGFPVERHWLADSGAKLAADPESAWFAVLLGRKM